MADIIDNLLKGMLNSELDKKNEQNNSNTSEELFYYIILDYDFPHRDMLGSSQFKGKYTGRIRDYIKESNLLPVVYNINDAKNICKKLIHWIMDKGTTKGKRMPVFGAMILSFKPQKGVSSRQIDDDVEQYGGKNYGNIFSKQNIDPKDIITYSVNGHKRGLVTNDVINNATLISASYGCMLNYDEDDSANVTPLHLGLLMLNMLPHFKEDDIRLLRQILKANGKEHVIISSQSNQSNQNNPNNANVDPILLNGIYNSNSVDNNNNTNVDDMKSNLTFETETSLSNFSSEQNQENLEGGHFKDLYKIEKERYKKLKQIAKSRGLI